MKPTPALLLTLLVTATLTHLTGNHRDWRQALMEDHTPVGAKQQKGLFTPAALQYPNSNQYRSLQSAAGGELSIGTDFKTSPAIYRVTQPQGVTQSEGWSRK